ncbi:hypothetical protein QE430_003303 [Microbacterium testaceum]|uniref:LlaJI family restriction endonuclease n=1 Tax=Microbacterium testaceum TaxID=2033 RepID=UPI002789ED1A|nr:LlaJI family restriction endonuclease [Microbacterium testaceum]MDQ1174996.1 hypothetical protein [Microbacterium testaceum]
MVDEAKMHSLGFAPLLADPRDTRRVSRNERRFNFVGFCASYSGDLLAVLPKHYEIDNAFLDLPRILRLISARRPEARTRLAEPDFEKSSDYPLSAFEEIYAHYRRWGLDTGLEDRYRPAPPGRVDWQKTIGQRNWVTSGDAVIPFPVVYRSTSRASTFLSECTIFAIDHTIDRFGVLLAAQPTGLPRPPFNLEIDRTTIVSRLWLIRSRTFRDTSLKLIDALISFFGSARSDASFILKMYDFYRIWEAAVEQYVNETFAGIDTDGSPSFIGAPSGISFEKTPFSLNRAAISQHIEPDLYGVSHDGRVQFIFDAKYYSSLGQLDYKQLSYTLLLWGLLDENGARLYERTHSALFLPSRSSRNQLHFASDDRRIDLKKSFPNLSVVASFLNARTVLNRYADR